MSVFEVPNNDLSSKIKFGDIVKMFDRIYLAKTLIKKSDVLKKYLESLKEFRSKFKSDTNEPECITSLYPVIRLLLPKLDQTSFGIRTTTMGKLYTRILGIDSNSEDAKKLSGSITLPSRGSIKFDYADTVYSVIKNRFDKTNRISVYEVNKYLEEISYNFHNNNRRKIEDDLLTIINLMTAEEQKWFVRIILKNLHLGVGQQKVFAALDPLAAELFSKYSDLQKVCLLIESGDLEITDNVELFSHIRPMLCGRIDINLMEKKLTNIELVLETKMDGERFQLHINNNEYRYFSRNGIEYTKIYGNNEMSDGTLTPYIYRNFSKSLKNTILDGEMMVWNKEKLFYHTKGENYDVKSLKKDHPTLRPCFCVFDILYLNDKLLINKPLVERKRLLSSLIQEQVGVLTLSLETPIKDNSQIMECLNSAIEKDEEGIVIKDIKSFYKPNERNAGWFKIKPDYIDGLVVDFDLTVIGGYYYSNTSYIQSFLLGIIEKASEPINSVFYAVGSVRSGLKKDEWKAINIKLKPHWIEVIKEKIGRNTSTTNPPNMKFGKSSPDVWINPKFSIVLEVKASELVRSTKFFTNYTLRFPRIISIRSDKNWDDCCTLEEFNKLCPSSSGAVQKIAKRYLPEKEIQVNIKRNRGPHIKTIPKLLPEKEIEKVDEVCAGLEFCILSSSKTHKQCDMEIMVLKHGGKIVKNPGASTFVVIAGDVNIRVKKLIELNKYNIAKADWLINALGDNEPKTQLLKFHPNDMFSTTSKLELQFRLSYDRFGDSYTEPLTKEKLNNIFSSIDIGDCSILTKSELNEIETKTFGPNKCRNFFRIFNAIFLKVSKNLSDDTMKLSQLIFKSRGGSYTEKFIDDFDFNTELNYFTHIFFNLSKINVKYVLDKFNSFMFYGKILEYNWIIECDKFNKIIGDEKFKLNRNV